jgi:hypothetical protein
MVRRSDQILQGAECQHISFSDLIDPIILFYPNYRVMHNCHADVSKMVATGQKPVADRW